MCGKAPPFRDIDWCFDGKQMVYTTGAQVRVVTLIRDFRWGLNVDFGLSPAVQ
jgi:hypothetical protein